MQERLNFFYDIGSTGTILGVFPISVWLMVTFKFTDYEIHFVIIYCSDITGQCN